MVRLQKERWREEEGGQGPGVRLVPPLQSGAQPISVNIDVNSEPSASDLEETLSEGETQNLSLLADAAVAQLG